MGNRDFGKRNFNDRGSGRPETFKTTCSRCGKECEVPFRPNGRKPVFCSACFRENGDRGFENRMNIGARDTGERNTGQNQYKEQFVALNSKLDRILKLLGSEEVKAVKENAATDYKRKEEIIPSEKKSKTSKRKPLIKEE